MQTNSNLMRELLSEPIQASIRILLLSFTFACTQNSAKEPINKRLTNQSLLLTLYLRFISMQPLFLSNSVT